MRKLILIMFLCLPFLSEGQVVYKDVYFYADSVSQTLDCTKGLYLFGLINPDDSFNFDSLWFKVSTDGSNFYVLEANADTLGVNFDSTGTFAQPLAEANFRLWKYFKFIMTSDIADTHYVRAVLKND